jgi:hypothetical protein
MGGNARRFAEERSFASAFLATWEMYRDAAIPAA